METNRNKRRGFMKGKLMPFYRAGKPSSAAAHYVTGNNKMMKPSHHSSSSPSTLGFLVHQDYVVSQPSKANKVSFLLPEQFESHYGVAGDEAVDSKAATYISSVQERFKLEGIKCQDYIRS